MVLSVVNITTQTLPLDSKPDLFYGQRHSFFLVQLDIMVVTHMGKESCTLLLFLIVLLDFLQPFSKSARITFVQ